MAQVMRKVLLVTDPGDRIKSPCGGTGIHALSIDAYAIHVSSCMYTDSWRPQASVWYECYE